MATFWFSPPVFVKTELVGVSYGCNNVRGAAEQLLEDAAEEEGYYGHEALT